MTPSADAIVGAARAWLGTPYRHQASTLGAGCDCLGLIRGVWRAVYGGEPVAMPNYSADWREASQRNGLLESAEALMERAEGQPRAGQLVLFRLQRALPPRHCGIMVAADRFIHAQEAIGVVEANMSESWHRRVAGSFAFPQIES
jgi:NlpC/P60 family putative phage cell wall peptidase